jgi:hypothetical protein
MVMTTLSNRLAGDLGGTPLQQPLRQIIFRRRALHNSAIKGAGRN